MYSPEAIPDGYVLAPHHFYIGVGIAVFGFLFVWRFYPRTGSVLSLLGLLIAVDDVIQHITGITTPLEYVWRVLGSPILRLLEGL